MWGDPFFYLLSIRSCDMRTGQSPRRKALRLRAVRPQGGRREGY